MTVKELIEMLEKCPPDALIMFEDEGGFLELAHGIRAKKMVKVSSLASPKKEWYFQADDLAVAAMVDVVPFLGITVIP